jgi:hypothetical protein
VVAFAYQIKEQETNEVLFEGILRNSEDSIYPAQESPELLKEFPTLPHECEFRHFRVNGLYTEGFYFDIPMSELEKWKS